MIHFNLMRFGMNVKKRFQKFLVQVQCTWFPMIDRTPQQFVDIYHAKPEDFRIATQRVYSLAEHATRIMRRVLPSETKLMATMWKRRFAFAPFKLRRRSKTKFEKPFLITNNKAGN